MKLIHCADIHLGSSLTSHYDKEEANKRKGELFATFSRMMRYAEDNGVTAVIIAGDLFDKNTGLKTIKKEVWSMLSSYPDIEVYYLKGNHDNDLEQDLIPENVHTFNDKWKTYAVGGNEKIKLHGTELSKTNAKTIFGLLTLNRDDLNIVTLHGQTSESAGKNDGELIELKSLRGRNIDYLALGHIHLPSGLKDLGDGRGKYCFPGCLEGRGFDEPGEHGFMLLDIDEDSLTYTAKFIDFATRHVFHDKIDITGVSTSFEASEKIKKHIRDHGCTTKDIAEFVLTGDIPIDTDIDEDLIKKQLEDYVHYVKICDDTQIELDFSQYENEESLKGEFVRTVMADDTLTEEDRMQIIKTGLDALAGKEIIV